MSANRDKGQRFTFLYSNLYQIHKKNDDHQKKVAIPTRPEDSRVIKVGDLKSGTIAKHYQVTEYTPTEIISKKSELSQTKKELLAQMRPNEALEGLRDNLNQLKDLHSRLKFMLTELEELTKK